MLTNSLRRATRAVFAITELLVRVTAGACFLVANDHLHGGKPGVSVRVGSPRRTSYHEIVTAGLLG